MSARGVIATLRERTSSLGDERGFTMIMAITVMLVSSVLLYAAIDAVTGDALPTRNDLDQSRALLAADAGLSAFRQQLNLSSAYWDTCPGVNGATGVTTTTGTTGATVGQSTDAGSAEYYSYRILPATTSPTTDTHCDTTDATATIIEGNSTASGSFRVEVTGTSRNVSRSIVAQFRPQSFLDYVYFTNYEMPDPLVAGGSCLSTYGNAPVEYWTAPSPTTGNNRNTTCGSIDFVTGDDIAGPLHSNDDLQVCGNPVFGRSNVTPDDAMETPGWYSGSGCTSSPTFNTPTGQPNTAAGTLSMPASDEATLLQIADGNTSATNGCVAGAGCIFTGPTTITLNGNTMNVSNASYSATGLAFPSNGLIYVQDGSGSCPTYSASSPAYPTTGSCGNATVSGTYTSSLTVATENDVIVNGSLTTPMTNGEPNDNAYLGLIADDFVRVAHTCNTAVSGINNTTNPEIDAAILALGHSFIVDNYGCGSPLGTLTVDGAIAQNFRGAVGTFDGNGNIVSGYSKNYIYDGALQTESPPYFLSPLGAPWELVRETECDTTC
jgi:Tfp pilus assembly protein PilX